MEKENIAQINASKNHTGRGRPSKWSVSMLQDEAMKYMYRGEFRKGSAGAYMRAKRIGVLDEICAHMKKKKPGYTIWTKDKIQEEAKKYSGRFEFSKRQPGAHSAAYRLGILDLVCSHMKFSGLKWDFDTCFIEAMKYETKQDFASNAGGAYAASRKGKWLDKVCAHMKKSNRRSDQVYIWEVISPIASNSCKVGVSTSSRPSGYRASQVSKSMGVGVGKYAEFFVGEDYAAEVERDILKSNRKCNLFSGDGSTEILHLNNKQYCDLILKLNKLRDQAHRNHSETSL